jgi:hypothetical protein
MAYPRDLARAPNPHTLNNNEINSNLNNKVSETTYTAILRVGLEWQR